MTDFILAARSMLTAPLIVTVFAILVAIAAYLAWMDKRDREQAQRERESLCPPVERRNIYITERTQRAQDEMHARADMARANREAAARRQSGGAA